MGSLDCTQHHWKNCSKYWEGQYRNRKVGKLALIQFEAVCDSDLYWWHVFGGRPGTNTDITVVEDSPLLRSILSGERRMKIASGYNLEEQVRHWFSYYLTDGIYKIWPIFVNPTQFPVTLKQENMTSIQESRRKDIERFFGVLRGRFKILRHEMLEWSDESVINIMDLCAIIHSMIVKLYQNDEGLFERDEAGEIVTGTEIVSEFIDCTEADVPHLTPVNISHIIQTGSLS